MSLRNPKLSAVLFLLLFSLSACQPPSQNTEKREQNPINQLGDAQLADVTIGLSMKTLTAPYFVAQLKVIEQEVKSRGMKFIYVDAQDDILRQVANVEDLLARGIDLLILNPLDPNALVMATKSAARAGVPVIIIDSSIDPEAEFVTIIQSNNLRNGELVGEWLVKQMHGQRINACVMSGAQGNPVGKERRQGVFRGIIEEQLRTMGETKFDMQMQGWGNWTYEGGLTAMEDMIVANPDINVLISEQDAMALGAMQAVREAGKEDQILIVSAADGQKEAFEMIKNGEYGATGLNDPELISKKAVDIAIRVLSGETGFPQVIYTQPACISIGNVEEFYDPNAIF